LMTGGSREELCGVASQRLMSWVINADRDIGSQRNRSMCEPAHFWKSRLCYYWSGQAGIICMRAACFGEIFLG
jgi:hypothetical protein